MNTWPPPATQDVSAPWLAPRKASSSSAPKSLPSMKMKDVAPENSVPVFTVSKRRSSQLPAPNTMSIACSLVFTPQGAPPALERRYTIDDASAMPLLATTNSAATAPITNIRIRFMLRPPARSQECQPPRAQHPGNAHATGPTVHFRADCPDTFGRVASGVD